MNYDSYKTDSNDPAPPECCEHGGSLTDCPDCKEEDREDRKRRREARGEFPEGSIKGILDEQ